MTNAKYIRGSTMTKRLKSTVVDQVCRPVPGMSCTKRGCGFLHVVRCA